ncbi:hypothetical protein INR49_030936 [Caranx melampygus]|nr:hypothetical protein INR49_030936 [Caranx melampygus]
MSVFDRLAPLMSQVSASSRQAREHPSVCLSPPLSLSSPVIKKKVIQIPSFDEKGLIYDKHSTEQTATDSSRSFVPICSSKTSSQASWSKSHQHSQSIHGDRASTLPRTKPKTLNSPTVSVKPSISIFPAPKPNSSPTLTALKPKPSDSLHLPASQLSDPPPSLHQLQPKPSVSPTLKLPIPRLSPSPTSLCQGMSLDGQRDKQPSPVARERRARSITISNPKIECKQMFSNEAKHDHLDQDTLLDFTHPHLRRSCAMTGRDSQQQTQFLIQATKSQSSCSLQSKVGLSKKENSSRDKPKPPPRNSDLSAIPKLKSNIKQQQEFLPSAATCTQTLLSESEGIHSADVVTRESQSAFDGLTTQRKCADNPQNRYKTQSASSASNNKAYEQMRSTALPTTSKMSFSTGPNWSRSTVSPSVETRRRQFDLHNEIKVDTTFPSGSNLRRPNKENNTQTVTGNSKPRLHQQTGGSEHIKSPQRHRLWSKAKSQTAQMDAEITVSQSDCFTKDYSCQSRGIDQETEASQHAHRLNRLKTCLVVPQTQEAPRPSPDEHTTPQTGSCSKPEFPSQRCLVDHKQNKIHKEVTLGDMGPNQTDIFAAPDHHSVPTKLLEHPSEKCVVSWPPSVAGCQFNTNSCGGSSKGVFDLPQHRVNQRPEETTTPATASLPPNQVDYSLTKRAFIMEEPEDPYYVTMYYPGSVYVDMSDVVPPEVKPKPAVPAKPPNVGAPSPSSPFPPQGPGSGAGGGGTSAPPPSGIPVPIGSHGPSHSASHGTGHGAGHGAGHTAAHSGGHGHGGSHSSSGGSTLLGYIGIDTIIEQMRKKTMKAGFDFNIMVVGHSGLGKSTLVNTLFKSHVSRRSAGWALLEEGGVKMKLTVVDTPGFGDQINNDNCWEPISKYINEQYEKFLKEEVNITRKKRIPDTRVHCCLYFITPTGHSLRPLDIEFMKRLSHSVNIIPVIAKADAMTIEERQEFKQRVRKELEMSGIEFYPQKEFDEDMEDKSDNDKIREAMPFAVVGSDKEYQVNGKRVLGRKTAWGIVEVENPNHCEFAQLRDFLIRSHLQDLKEVTHNIHYETYRAKRLNENGGLHPISSSDTQESNL